MKILTKRLVLPLIIFVTLTLVIMPSNYLTKKSGVEEVLFFLENVVNLQMSTYKVELMGTFVTYPDWLNNTPQLNGKYELRSDSNKIDVLFKFRNNKLSWCLMRVLEGDPRYIDPHFIDFRTTVEKFLQKYHAYSGDSEIKEMESMLDTINLCENTTKMEDNLSLTVSVKTFSSSFYWKFINNDTENNGFNISFHNGQFYAFSLNRI